MSANITLRTLTLPRNMMAKKEAIAEFKDKIKSSYYLDIKTEERIMALYMKRLKEGQRARKSQLVDEAIKLLYDKEIGKN